MAVQREAELKRKFILSVKRVKPYIHRIPNTSPFSTDLNGSYASFQRYSLELEDVNNPEDVYSYDTNERFEEGDTLEVIRSPYDKLFSQNALERDVNGKTERIPIKSIKKA